MTSWDDFVLRRAIKFQEFCKRNMINSAEDLVKKCSDFGVEPPGKMQLAALFPPQVPVNDERVASEDDAQQQVKELVPEKEEKRQYNKKKKGDK